ncbi:MAG: glycosyltransferase, partial [Thermoplasmata archaeon]|nr:glycosyltransferase [Thermoplasmata archaeon]
MVKLPAGIDTETFHPSNHDPDVLGGLGVDPSRPVILFVGRLAARKGVFDLLEIFSIVRGEVDGAQLVVVGEGPQFEGLKRRSR